MRNKDYYMGIWVYSCIICAVCVCVYAVRLYVCVYVYVYVVNVNVYYCVICEFVCVCACVLITLEYKRPPSTVHFCIVHSFIQLPTRTRRL